MTEVTHLIISSYPQYGTNQLLNSSACISVIVWRIATIQGITLISNCSTTNFGVYISVQKYNERHLNLVDILFLYVVSSIQCETGDFFQIILIVIFLSLEDFEVILRCHIIIISS